MAPRFTLPSRLVELARITSLHLRVMVDALDHLLRDRRLEHLDAVVLLVTLIIKRLIARNVIVSEHLRTFSEGRPD